MKGKNHYLEFVKADDVIKDKVTGCYLTHIRGVSASAKRSRSEKNKTIKKDTGKTPKMSNLEQKTTYNEVKRVLKQVWTTATGSSSENEGVEVPSHYKKYTIQDRQILLQTPERQRTQPGTSFDGPKNSKRIDLAKPGEVELLVYIANDLTPAEEQEILPF